ncbi:IPExxxVDY family protein [Reichenbachiella carrageenanivorans]|uniref:IPExxxVDY family protein n=1 Tax=Reichenbachiella carrageenanivorans TaxID=2979869 RepID=A0ABY6CUR3_9BACT|nr:IPExxxVDY family protein [Reichenbachiella carrageenanivorans]UXX77656.1 IPExxxVDY family protein [Reichenbachiella carrageenanivorans]
MSRSVRKLKLKADYSYDFHLIGIISQAKDYTVSWAINRALNIGLKKEPDLEVDLKNAETLTISNFVFENDFRRFTLITNKVVVETAMTQKLFVPSLGTFDFLLKIEEFEETSDLEILFTALRRSEKIDSIVKLDVNKIKEKESFLF